ncbi:MAG: KaiB domain protein [Acidimicrobiales bacterium]|nr:KaiB domain protein [Acidimicrobiales bacterium]
MEAGSDGAAALPKDEQIWSLRLYIAGQSPRSLNALANLTELCQQHLGGRHDIETIDLVRDPSRARDDDILAIPTLIRSLPLPERKIIGDLSDTKRTLAALRLQPTGTE